MDERSPVITDATWEEYEKTKDPDIRNEILMEYLHLVKVIVGRAYKTYRNYVDPEDLVSVGTLALMNAIENFSYTRGVKFATYASIRIRGSLIDHMRKQDWVPRNLRRSVKEIEEACQLLQNRAGREPTEEELAAYLGTDVKRISRLMRESNSFSVLSFEELLAETLADNTKSASEGPEQRAEDRELREIIAAAIDTLSEKERIVISLYYYEEIKSKDIAAILELSESRVSQIHSRTLTKLRGIIEGYMVGRTAG